MSGILSTSSDSFIDISISDIVWPVDDFKSLRFVVIGALTDTWDSSLGTIPSSSLRKEISTCLGQSATEAGCFNS
ncbi:hypothetical protein PsorP6_010120 [Peronosclerospora sorghi]|uniref:Uncharacterized protein n=1 Tax=Peronosclerospora sorghi TaxID=230839 RepID=A0ACC0VX00_9STRA|nr:hypothetical protein PsorP6_010120 [Peronosclerospora sorghi]